MNYSLYSSPPPQQNFPGTKFRLRCGCRWFRTLTLFVTVHNSVLICHTLCQECYFLYWESEETACRDSRVPLIRRKLMWNQLLWWNPKLPDVFWLLLGEHRKCPLIMAWLDFGLFLWLDQKPFFHRLKDVHTFPHLDSFVLHPWISETMDDIYCRKLNLSFKLAAYYGCITDFF